MTGTNPHIYLASSSPRRQQLLDQVSIRYIVVHPQITEIPEINESPLNFAVRNAVNKARAGKNMIKDKLDLPILGADTVVTLGNRIFGKPEDQTDCINMLEQLSDKSHDVITAIALISESIEYTDVSISSVTFRKLDKAECEQYWLTGEPADKAGSYAIQGKGAAFVQQLTGSYSGVMGLPLYETTRLLMKSGITIF